MLLIAVGLAVIPLLVVAEALRDPIEEEVIQDTQLSIDQADTDIIITGESNNTARKYDDIVRRYSTEYGVDYNLMNAIMNCENYSRDPGLQSGLYYNFTREDLGIYINQREESYGLVQINLHYNPNITHIQATDPDFSIEFLAKHLAIGRGSMWACYSSGDYKRHL